jgi:hypothetical protein
MDKQTERPREGVGDPAEPIRLLPPRVVPMTATQRDAVVRSVPVLLDSWLSRRPHSSDRSKDVRQPKALAASVDASKRWLRNIAASSRMGPAEDVEDMGRRRPGRPDLGGALPGRRGSGCNARIILHLLGTCARASEAGRRQARRVGPRSDRFVSLTDTIRHSQGSKAPSPIGPSRNAVA